jgi:hypothetical protein
MPMPKTTRYVLKALIFAGQAFPQRSMLSSSRYSVELRLMHRRLVTPELRMDSGYAAWDKPVLLKDTFELPENACMLPDLFVYILNKSEEMAPLCYKRIPLVHFLGRAEEKQFQTPADWEILKLDDSYSFPSQDVFPGAVLMKIGFGKEEVANRYPWQSSVVTKCSPCQVNIHVYQGRGLPPSDSTGLLDPYILVRVGTSILKTHVHKQTRDPQFYQTLSFHMDLPEDDDLKPQLFLELFDQDLAGDDFVGLIKLDLALADKRAVAGRTKQQLLSASLRQPEWYGLRSKKGADLMGQLLVGFEILHLDKPGAPLLPSPALEPETIPWILSMNILGLRDLEPAGVVPVYKPYAHIALNDEELRKLPPSRKPTPTDPNYLCSFEEVVHLPRDVRFAPSIAVAVKDRKVAGLPATTLGAVSIPLDHKMASSSAPGSETISAPPGREVAQFRHGNPFLSTEDLINSQILLHDSALTQKEDESRWEDSDKGRSERALVQGSLVGRIADTRSQMPSDDVPEYLHRRLSIPTELELALREAPFERYPITTGSVASGAENMLDKPFSQIGVLKCTVSARPEGSPPPSTLARISTAEQEVKVPIICLRLSI